MRSLLIRCYPARWRARYGDEFEAILEERSLGPFDVADILLGALDARLRSNWHGAGIQQGRSLSMSLRIGGFAGILAATLLAVAWFMGYGFVDIDPTIAGVVFLAGLSVLLVALAGLSAFQARIDPHLTWAAFALCTVGLIVFVAGALATTLIGDSYWDVTFIGVLVALLGSTLFAIVTYRTAALSRGAALLIGVGSVLPFVASAMPLLNAVSIVCFLSGWFALGVQAIRLDRPATEPRPA
jgi:hypothetical protein